MPVPSQPSNFIPRPFATGGSFTVIPDTTTASGRASFTSGFPTETQLPLAQGGVAPNRTDFNGLFNLMTAFGFWQQSGGVWTYSAKLNYTTPNIVYYNKYLWWCIKNNGPDSGNGAVTPGTNEAYWMELFEYFGLREEAEEIEIPDPTPVGTIIMYPLATPPEGYFACNGGSFSASTYPKLYALLGSSILPDMRGYFVRGYDTRDTVDPDGASRTIRSVQEDAMQSMSGTFRATQQTDESTATGVFTSTPVGPGDKGNYSSEYHEFTFSNRNMVRTATENRPKNIAMLYCIKHD